MLFVVVCNGCLFRLSVVLFVSVNVIISGGDMMKFRFRFGCMCFGKLWLFDSIVIGVVLLSVMICWMGVVSELELLM